VFIACVSSMLELQSDSYKECSHSNLTFKASCIHMKATHMSWQNLTYLFI